MLRFINSTCGIIVYLTLAITLAFLCIFGNASTIIAFTIKSSLQKNPSFWYITSLAVADLLVGLVSIPTTVYDFLTDDYLPTSTCDVILVAHLIPIIPTFVHLLMVSLDRYFKLVSPLKYIRFMTVTKAKVIIIFMWLTGFSVTGAFLLIPGHEYENNCLVIKMNSKDTNGNHIWLFLTFFQYVPFCLLMLCNYRVYVIATNFKRAVEQQLTVHDANQQVQLRYHSGRLIVDKNSGTNNHSNGSNHSTQSDDALVVCHSEDTQLVKARKLAEWTRTAIRQRKIAILVSVIVMAAAVCWFPASTAYMMTWFCKNCRIKGTFVELFHPWFLYINSALNPLILLFMSEDFRKAYRLIYSKVFQFPLHKRYCHDDKVPENVKTIPNQHNI